MCKLSSESVLLLLLSVLLVLLDVGILFLLPDTSWISVYYLESVGIILFRWC